MNLDPLAQARAANPVSWCTLFVKAYARTALRIPELRRAYISFPFAHIYEHPATIASVAVERSYRGEPAVFFVHFRYPEQQTLQELEASLRRYREVPLEEIGLIRRALYVSRFPRPLRRAIWWYGLNSSGAKRARRMGTFGVSVYSSLGSESLHPLSPLTTTLTYGVIESDGRVPVRIVYDHRVMDGSVVARALAQLETILNHEIRAELAGEPREQAA
jgi:hypothetical protein